jgi:hypothetical protein
VVVPSFWTSYWRGNGGRSYNYDLSPGLDFRIASRWTSSLSFGYNWNRDDRQWYQNYLATDGSTHYTFAHLAQRTARITARVNYTASPTLSLQVYAQPFISKGRFSDIRELASPGARQYDDRFMAYPDPAVRDNPAQFNVKQFRSNVVLRWEYRPGSALFLVWQQGREDNEPTYGSRDLGGDLGRLFRSHANNTLLVKESYWFER